MSDTSRVADAVTESVDVLTNSLEWVPDELAEDGDGTSTGRAVGARIGREIGAVLGRSVGELVAAELREESSSDDVPGEVREFLVAVFSELLTDADADSALAEIQETARSLPEQAGEEAADEDESSADDESADEAEGDESESDGEDGAGVTSPEELDNLREETLREILDLMSYDELQSIAKKVGVKANLDMETMRERIVEEFTADEEDTGDAEDSTNDSDE